MHVSVAVSEQLADAHAFADSVAGTIARHRPDSGQGWTPGAPDPDADAWPRLDDALSELGWPSVATDPELITCAGLGAIELGRGPAPVRQLDRLLGAAPVAGELLRCPVPGGLCLRWLDGEPVVAPVIAADRLPSTVGLQVCRPTKLGAAEPVDTELFAIAWRAWVAAGVGYLAGLGEAALELTVSYVSDRAAFDTTLGALAPVQQLLAGAATKIRGAVLLSEDAPDESALRHAGPAIVAACDACQQVTGAIGYTLEYPLHRYSQLARGLAAYNDALLDELATASPLRRTL